MYRGVTVGPLRASRISIEIGPVVGLLERAAIIHLPHRGVEQSRGSTIGTPRTGTARWAPMGV